MVSPAADIGLVRNLAVTSAAKEIEGTVVSRQLLVEMLARLLKSRVQEDWRRTVRSHYHINNELCKEQALDALNSFLDLQTPDNIKYWSTDAKVRLLGKFKGAFLEKELNPTFDPRRLLATGDFTAVLERFQTLTGFHLRPQAFQDFQKGSSLFSTFESTNEMILFKFLRCDAYTIEATIKHTNIVDFADIQSLLIGGVQQSDLNSSNRYFVLVLAALRKSPRAFELPLVLDVLFLPWLTSFPDMTLMGASKLLEICSILSKKVKATGTANLDKSGDAFLATLVELVKHLLATSEELGPSLRLPILVKGATLLRHIGTPSSRGELRDRLEVILQRDPFNIKALLAVLRLTTMDCPESDVKSVAERIQRIRPQDSKFNIIMANYELIKLKQTHAYRREEDMPKILGYFSLAAQMDPNIVRKAAFGIDPGHQEAQLRMTASVPQYRPFLREFYERTKSVTLIDPLPGGGDGLIVTISTPPSSLEYVKFIRALGLTDAGLEKAISSAEGTLKYCDLRGTADAASKTATALQKCENLVSLKVSDTGLRAADVVPIVKRRPALEILRTCPSYCAQLRSNTSCPDVDSIADFSDAALEEVSQLPCAATLTSIGIGATAVTAASIPSLSRFLGLSKLFLRKTEMPWETCYEVMMGCPQLGLFSVEKSPNLKGCDLFKASICTLLSSASAARLFTCFPQRSSTRTSSYSSSLRAHR